MLIGFGVSLLIVPVSIITRRVHRAHRVSLPSPVLSSSAPQ
jgi:hypothetical protein